MFKGKLPIQPQIFFILKMTLLKKIGSVEFLLPAYEMQNTGEMTEGTVPVPPDCPCAA